MKLIVHLRASSAKVKNEWSHTSAVIYVFMILCIVKHGGNFTFEDYCLLWYDTICFGRDLQTFGLIYIVQLCVW